MKKIIVILLLILSLNIFAEKTRIAVVDFSAKGELINEAYLAEAIVENLITAFIDSNEFQVMERNMLKEIMRELQLQNSDDFNDELREQIGSLYGAELVILGSLTKIGSRYTINVRGVEVKTGVAKFAKNLSTDSKETLVDLIPEIVYLITGKATKEDVEKRLKELEAKDKKRKKFRKKEENKDNNEYSYKNEENENKEKNENDYSNNNNTKENRIEEYDNIKPTLKIDKQSYLPGEKIILSFTASSNYDSNSWIGIVPSNINHGSESLNDSYDITFQYLNKKTKGTLTFYAPNESGNYDFRLNDSDSNGNEVAYVNFEVRGVENKSSNQAKVYAAKSIFSVNEPIKIEWSGLPGNNTDWITIVKSTAPSNSYKEWFYTKGKTSGSYTFKALEPGDYEVRVFYNYPNGGYVIQAKYGIKVE